MSFEVESKSLENEQLDTASLKSRIGKEADAAASPQPLAATRAGTLIRCRFYSTDATVHYC